MYVMMKTYKEVVSEKIIIESSPELKELNLQKMKLLNKALKMMPNSPKQLKVRKEIDEVNKKMTKLMESVILESKPLFEFKGVKVFPTNHSVEREVQRMDDTSKKLLEYISMKAVAKLSLRTQGAEYLIYSNKYKRGIVVDHREDKYGSDNKLHLFIITILPKGKKQPKAGTRMVMVENYLAENNLKFDEDHIIIIDDEIND